MYFIISKVTFHIKLRPNLPTHCPPLANTRHGGIGLYMHISDKLLHQINHITIIGSICTHLHMSCTMDAIYSLQKYKENISEKIDCKSNT
jgi:hypothetical protein